MSSTNLRFSRRANIFLSIVQNLENTISEDAMANNKLDWLKNVPVLRSPRKRNKIRTALLVLLSINVLLVYIPINLLPGRLKYYTGAVLLVFFFVSLFGVAKDAPRTTRYFPAFKIVSALFVYVTSTVIVVLLIGVFLINSSEPDSTQLSREETVSLIGAFSGFVLALRPINAMEWGNGRLRIVRLFYARASWFLFMPLIAFLAVFSLLYGAQSVDPKSSIPDSPLAQAGFLITVGVLILGLLSRISGRQRKYLILLSQSLADLETALSCNQSREIIYSAGLNLDVCLATGIDTGVRIFATPYESDEMRAIILAALEFSVTGINYPEDKYLTTARKAVINLDFEKEVIKSLLVSFLAFRRRQLSYGIDVAA